MAMSPLPVRIFPCIPDPVQKYCLSPACGRGKTFFQTLAIHLLCLLAAGPAPVFGAAAPPLGEIRRAGPPSGIVVRSCSVYLYPHRVEPPVRDHMALRHSGEIAHSRISQKDTRQEDSPTQLDMRGRPVTKGLPPASPPDRRPWEPLLDITRDRGGKIVSTKLLGHRKPAEGVFQSPGLLVEYWLRELPDWKQSFLSSLPRSTGSPVRSCPEDLVRLISMFVFPILSFTPRECYLMSQWEQEIQRQDLARRVADALQKSGKKPSRTPRTRKGNTSTRPSVYPAEKVTYQAVSVLLKRELEPLLFWKALARELRYKGLGEKRRRLTQSIEDDWKKLREATSQTTQGDSPDALDPLQNYALVAARRPRQDNMSAAALRFNQYFRLIDIHELRGRIAKNQSLLEAQQDVQAHISPPAAHFIYFCPPDKGTQYFHLLKSLSTAPPDKVDEKAASCLAWMAEEEEQGKLYFEVLSPDKGKSLPDATAWLAMRCEAFPDRWKAKVEHLLVSFTWGAYAATKRTGATATPIPPIEETKGAERTPTAAGQLSDSVRCLQALPALNLKLLRTLQEACPRVAPDIMAKLLLCLQRQVDQALQGMAACEQVAWTMYGYAYGGSTRTHLVLGLQEKEQQ